MAYPFLDTFHFPPCNQNSARIPSTLPIFYDSPPPYYWFRPYSRRPLSISTSRNTEKKKKYKKPSAGTPIVVKSAGPHVTIFPMDPFPENKTKRNETRLKINRKYNNQYFALWKHQFAADNRLQPHSAGICQKSCPTWSGPR